MPTLCGSGVGFPDRCESKEYFASTLAMILGAMGGLFTLVQQRVYRPLLVIIVASLALWNVLTFETSLPWWGFTLLMAIIFALAYGAFAWVVQLRNLYLALGASAILVVAIRLIMGS